MQSARPDRGEQAAIAEIGGDDLGDLAAERWVLPAAVSAARGVGMYGTAIGKAARRPPVTSTTSWSSCPGGGASTGTGGDWAKAAAEKLKAAMIKIRRTFQFLIRANDSSW